MACNEIECIEWYYSGCKRDWMRLSGLVPLSSCTTLVISAILHSDGK
jgi:hypothetical protein